MGASKGQGGEVKSGKAPARRWRPRVLWRQLLLAVGSTALFFALLEGILALAGVRPVRESGDPFVGFVSNLPLFVEQADPQGRPVWATAPNKLGFFNRQSFPARKAPGAYRIFCLGGSTTYGRPYDDATSFAGWLRELLPAADPGRSWEVINAGGISYASYRVAALMEELVRHRPDLFIVYSGHNEFLEERTYGSLRDLPAPLRSLSALLARTRTWAALGSLIERLRRAPAGERRDQRTLLPEQVNAKLDRSAGLQLYQRDDPLRDQVLAHYSISLGRMVEIARGAGAEILFVTPASNLRDFSPFKSQHGDGLEAAERARSETLLGTAGERIGDGRWSEALASLDEALGLDPRYAELHYRRGRALLELGRGGEARQAYLRARDEDVCPLRALSPMLETLGTTARRGGVPVVDFAGLLDRRAEAERGHPIPGAESFLDHVHPIIAVHRLLALALIEKLAELGIVHPSESWNERTVSAIAARVEAAVDRQKQARALANLALTLSWAGKVEDSRRLAFQALEMGVEDPTILLMAARHYAIQGDGERALAYFQRALRANPGSPVVHLQMGLLLSGRRELEAAAAHYFLASLLWPDNPQTHQHLGFVMAQLGRYAAALESLLRAQSLDPANSGIEARIAALRQRLGAAATPAPPRIAVTRHPSGRPHTVAQTRPGPGGGQIADGIWTEWYESGELKGYAEFAGGEPEGTEVTWDREGRELSRNPAPGGGSPRTSTGGRPRPLRDPGT